MRARGATLIEAVVVIAILALSVPAAVAMLGQASDGRADSVSLARATLLAEGVLDHVLADVASAENGLGFQALAEPAVYLAEAGTGLRTRIASFTAGYESVGLSYEVLISDLVSTDGSATGDPQRDLFRVVEVLVRAPSAVGTPLLVRVSTMVADL